MNFEITFICPQCRENVDGRFQPCDENGESLLIICEKCGATVGYHYGKARNKCDLCGQVLCHVSMCTDCRRKLTDPSGRKE